jgi:hypothetical protein
LKGFDLFDCFLFIKEYPPKRSLPRRDDFSIVNIVQEPTPIVRNYEKPLKSIPPVMDTIVQQTFVSPAKLDFKKLEEDTRQPQQSQQQPITATEQLAEQTAQLLEDIRK